MSNMDSPSQRMAPAATQQNTWEGRNPGQTYISSTQAGSATSSYNIHPDGQHIPNGFPESNSSNQASDVSQPLTSSFTHQAHSSPVPMSTGHYAPNTYTSSRPDGVHYSQSEFQYQPHLHGQQQDDLHSRDTLSSSFPSSPSGRALPSCATPVTGPGGGKDLAGGQSVNFADVVDGREKTTLRLQPAPPGRLYSSGYLSSSSSDPHSYSMQPASSSSSSCASYAAYPYATTSKTAGQSGYPSYTIAASSADSGASPGLSTRVIPQHSRSSHAVSRYDHQTPLWSTTPMLSATQRAEDKIASHAGLSNQEWPGEDILSLVYVLNEVEGRSWTEIAKRAFPDDRYTPNECQEKWREFSKDKKPVNRGPWSHAEDQALLNATNLLGPDKWVVIATQVGARNGKQCRERWHNHLSPSIKKGPFTPEEDESIFHWYSVVGSKWSEIAKHLPGRPDNMIKNHFNTSLQRQRRRLNRQSGASARKGTSTNDTKSNLITRLRSISDRSTTTIPNERSRLLLSSENQILPVSFPMSKSSSSSSVVSLTRLNDVPTSSTSFPRDEISPYALAVSSGPLASSEVEQYPPIPSSGNFSNNDNMNMASSPTLSARYASSHTRPSYHPYARGPYPASQHAVPHRTAMLRDPGASDASASHSVEQQLTTPTTPEYEVQSQYYPISQQYHSRKVAVPASAPPSREYFNIVPTTPARRATLADSPRRSNQAGNAQSQEMSPMTATSQAFGNMFFGQKQGMLPADSDYETSRSQQQEGGTLSRMDMPAPRAMQLSSLLSGSVGNSPNLGLGLIAPQARTPVRSGNLDNYGESTTHRDRLQYCLNDTSTLYPHLQPAPPVAGYTSLKNAEVCYTPRNGSISSSSAGTSASLMSPINTSQALTALSGGFPPSAPSMGSVATSLASPASKNAQGYHYARENSFPSPGGSHGSTAHPWEQYEPSQGGNAYSFARERGYYQPISPLDSNNTALSRSRASSDVHSSTSESFAAPFTSQASLGRVGGLLGGRGSISNQSIQEEQEESMHSIREDSDHTAVTNWNSTQQASYPVHTYESQPYSIISSSSRVETPAHHSGPLTELTGLSM